jgi:CST complex subunit TEN1
LKSYDAQKNRAIIEYKDFQLKIDTSLLDVFQHKMNALFQLIGEIECDAKSSGGNEVLLKSRVIRCVEGLDLDLWEQALELRRKFECEPTNESVS